MQPFMDMIGEITGVIPCNFSNIFRIEDTIFIQVNYKLCLLDFVTKNIV